MAKQQGGKQSNKQFNYDLLLKRMKVHRHSQTTLSELMEISRATLNAKMNSRIPFTQKDIISICHILEISNDEVGDYFFHERLDKEE
ncbi:MAG: DUF739 family protein [Alkalibacterium sp.]|nr:DUF739 family protein [Alkalibacterium sp.]